jgi:hypothetical protein
MSATTQFDTLRLRLIKVAAPEVKRFHGWPASAGFHPCNRWADRPDASSSISESAPMARSRRPDISSRHMRRLPDHARRGRAKISSRHVRRLPDHARQGRSPQSEEVMALGAGAAAILSSTISRFRPFTAARQRATHKTGSRYAESRTSLRRCGARGFRHRGSHPVRSIMGFVGAWSSRCRHC